MPSPPRPRLLVIGDSCVDRWTVGPATRVNPEAPTLVIEPSSVREGPGGAAAVAYIAAGLGADVTLLTVSSNDENGAILESLLFGAGVKRIGDCGGRLTVKHRICAESNGHGLQPIVRLDENHLPPEHATVVLSTEFESAVERGVDCILIADYGRGVCSRELLTDVMRIAEEHGVPVLVDPAKGRSFWTYSGASLIKMNRNEWDATKPADDDPTKAACYPFVMVTRDKDGAELTHYPRASMTCEEAIAASMRKPIHKADETYRSPSLATSIVDVTGAGDAILAALGALVARSGGLDGIAPERLLRVAMRAAAAEVAQFGVSQIPASMLEEEPATVKEDLTVQFNPPVIENYKTNYVLEWLKMENYPRRLDDGTTNQPRPVVLVNGCFDVVHRGHAHLFRQAKHVVAGENAILVVAINSDASVRRLKGDSRPVNNHNDRAAFLREMKCVDYVVIFDDDTPLRVIEAIRPDVLVRGDEPGEIVGQSFVESYGGRVVRVPKVPGVSTTAIADRLRASNTKGGE